MKIQCYDYLGWPVELIKGRPVTNLIRRVLHTRGLRVSIGTAPHRPLVPPARVGTGGVAGQAQGTQAPAKPLPADTVMPWGRSDSALGQRRPPGGLH